MPTLGADAVLAALDSDQRAVAEAPPGPLVVLAGAGSGKTRAITHRIAYAVLTGRQRDDRVLPLAFTNRAAAEMTARLRTLGVPVRARTFHAAALAQVRHFWPTVAGGRPPRLLAAKSGRLAEALRAAGLPAAEADVRTVASVIERAKASQVTAVDFAAVLGEQAALPGWSAVDLAAGYGAYEAAKDAAAEMDFEDCLLLAIALLEEDRRVLEQVRDRYRHLVVDEYQDVNPLQQRLLDLWLGDRDDLCVVGDAAQSIYSFTGATPTYLLRFRRRHPSATEIRLDRDYRSTPQVVAAANQLLGGTGEAVRLRAQQPAGPPVRLDGYADEADEAGSVAASVARIVGAGTAASQIAVLVRTNSQAGRYLRALADVGVSAVPAAQERWFAAPEVKRALVRLRGARAADPAQSAVAAAEEALLAEGWLPEVERDTGPLDPIRRLADQLGSAATVADLVADLTEREELAAPPLPEAVTVTTLHAAKGREWDAVFIPGLIEGLLPVAPALTEEALAEERRLLYVGITRARRDLYLSWYEGAARRSRFLDDLAVAES